MDNNIFRVLSFGAGVQTTAIAVLVNQGKIKIDLAVFADTGAEKPETYWYMENYTKPLLKEVGIDLVIVKNKQPSAQPDLYGYLWKYGQIPAIGGIRLCSVKFKRDAVCAFLKGKTYKTLIGFSSNEISRAVKQPQNEFPLIDMALSANDCREIIKSAGLPQPLKSSCYFCPFQHPVEWNWLKNKHRDLFDKALALEAHYHERRPDMRELGLMRGYPLRKYKDGIQPEMFGDGQESCWEGYCGV